MAVPPHLLRRPKSRICPGRVPAACRLPAAHPWLRHTASAPPAAALPLPPSRTPGCHNSSWWARARARAKVGVKVRFVSRQVDHLHHIWALHQPWTLCWARHCAPLPWCIHLGASRCCRLCSLARRVGLVNRHVGHLRPCHHRFHQPWTLHWALRCPCRLSLLHPPILLHCCCCLCCLSCFSCCCCCCCCCYCCCCCCLWF